MHAREACKSGQARVDPLERDEIDDGSLHRQKQEINSLYRQEAMFFCLLCIKILLSARSTTNSAAFLEKNDGGASACESPVIRLISDTLHPSSDCCAI